MDSLNVKNINDEKIFNVIDPNGQGEVVNRIRPISITITQKAETINNETVSNVSLSVYWNDTWKSILELSFDDSLRQEYGKLVTDLTAIQKDIDMKQYKDAETKTNDFLKYVSNLSSKYTNIPETKTVATSKNDFVSIIAERNNFKVNISDTLLNFMLKKFAKVDNLDYKKANECHSINRTSCIENSIDMYFHSPELFKKQAYMTIVKDNKVVGSYKATYDEFCKLASKFDLTPQKFGYSKDRLAGYMKTAEVVMQNIFFDSVDEAKEWQEMVDEKKKEEVEPAQEGQEESIEEKTTTTTTEEKRETESPVKEDGGLARPSEDFASDEIPESEPRQQEQQQGGQMAASRRLNLLKKKALKKKAGTANFKTYDKYPLIAIGDDDVFSQEDFVESWNENNPDNQIKDWHEEEDKYYDWLNDDYDYVSSEMKEAIDRKDTPYHNIGIEGGYYEGLQLTVEEDSGAFFNDYDNEHEDEYSEYFESHNYAELPKEYEDARLDAWNKECDRVAQIMRDLGKEQGWGEYTVAYRFSNGETGYSRVKASKKELKLKRKANFNKKATNYLSVPELKRHIKQIIKEKKGMPCSEMEFIRKVSGLEKPIQVTEAYGNKKIHLTYDNYKFLEYSKGAKLITELAKDDGYQTVECWIFDKQEEKEEQSYDEIQKEIKNLDKQAELKVGDIVRMPNKIWVKIKEIVGDEAIVNLIDKSDIEMKSIPKELLIPLDELLTQEEIINRFREGTINGSKKQAIEGDVQEQDIVPAKTETKVYLQSETNKCAGRYKDKVAEMLNEIEDPTPLITYISESEAKEICEELDIPHEATWYKGDLLGYVEENPYGIVDTLMEYISESDAKALWSQINIGASQKTQVKKHAGYTYKEISNIGYEEGTKDGAKYKETGEIQLQTEIDKNLKELKAKYEKDEDMGSYVLREWDSFVAGYTNGFSDGWTGHVEKKAAEETVEEKMEKQVGEDGDVKGVIGVGDIVCIKFYNLSEGDFAKYSEFLGMPMLLIENDKEDINKVIIEQVEYPFQRVTINKDNIGLFDNIKEEQVLVEDVDGDEMITDFVELPIVAKQCKIKSIHKAARLGGK